MDSSEIIYEHEKRNTFHDSCNIHVYANPTVLGQLPVRVTRFSRNSRSSHWRRVRQCMEVVRTTSGKGEWWIQNPPKMMSSMEISPPKFNSEFPPEKRCLEDDSFLLDPFLLGVGLFSVPTLNLQGVIFVGEMYFLMHQSQDGHWKHPLDLMTRGKKTSECLEKTRKSAL